MSFTPKRLETKPQILQTKRYSTCRTLNKRQQTSDFINMETILVLGSQVGTKFFGLKLFDFINTS